MPNLSVQLSAVINVTDTTQSPSPAIITRSLLVPTLAVTSATFLTFPQVTTTPIVVALPAATVSFMYVRNLSTAGNLLVTYTPVGGSAQTVVLGPGATADTGGYIIYGQTQEGQGGVTALSIVSSTGTVSADVIVAQ